MCVPKAAVDKDGQLGVQNNYVWLTGQVCPLPLNSEAELSQGTVDGDLRAGITPLHGAHYSRALGGAKYICHQRAERCAGGRTAAASRQDATLSAMA